MNRRLLLLLTLMTGTAVVADEMPQTISVSGTGSATIAPDRAQVTMSVMVRDKSLDAAQEQAARVTQQVLAMTDALDIERRRVDSTGASVRPDYRYNNKTNEQELRGYVASRNIMIDVRDLDKLAPIVEGAVDAGVNQVSPPQLYSSKRRTAYREALDKAAADARANAEQLAKSLDVELGDAISISSLPMATPVPQHYMARAMAADAGAEATYNAGDQSIDATVTVIFEIDD